MRNINDDHDLLTMEVEQVDAEVVLLRPVGEIDLATGGYFRDRLLAAVSAASGMVIVDLAGVNFLASSGLAALLDGRHEATERGVEVVLTGGGRAALRALEITGLLTMLRHCESVERALDPVA